MARVLGFDESVKKRITCCNCSAIVEYVRAEVQTGMEYDYTGSGDSYYFIQCPNCSKEIKVK